MIIISMVVYVCLGMVAIAIKRNRLKEDLQVDGPLFRVYVYRFIVVVFAMLFWPALLLSESETDMETTTYYKDRDIILEVTDAFKSVAEYRKEHINQDSLKYISAKFIKVYGMLGEQVYKEHLKYELDKYYEEGLREEYLVG
ncbi:hypothetical protein [Desulforhopalus sp. 52FAK]